MATAAPAEGRRQSAPEVMSAAPVPNAEQGKDAEAAPAPKAQAAPAPKAQQAKAPEGPPEALDRLATLDYEEAELLLRLNAQDVDYYFRRKGVPSIGKALAAQGVSGSSLHMLSPQDIETRLGLNLGQQLALKGFIKQMQAISKNRRRVERIWVCEEASDTEEMAWKPGCCLCAWFCCYGVCCRPQGGKPKKPPSAKLKKARYTLSNTELSVETWSWVDSGIKDSEVLLKSAPNCGCGALCGYTLEPTPQQCTTTNNIDLSCVEDVDNKRFTRKTVGKQPVCAELCCGYMERTVTPAALVTVTYVDRGNVDSPRRMQKEFRVKPDVVDNVTRLIIAEKESAMEASSPRKGGSKGAMM